MDYLIGKLLDQTQVQIRTLSDQTLKTELYFFLYSLSAHRFCLPFLADDRTYLWQNVIDHANWQVVQTYSRSFVLKDNILNI